MLLLLFIIFHLNYEKRNKSRNLETSNGLAAAVQTMVFECRCLKFGRCTLVKRKSDQYVETIEVKKINRKESEPHVAK